MKKILNALFILITLSYVSFGQEESYNIYTRTVVITYPDSVIKANILSVKEDIKVNDELKYYCYNNNKIVYNRGAINGKPLHGVYSVYNEGLLVLQGEFRYGLKNGKWKSWNVSGEFKKIENWDKGLLQGEQKYFSETGEIIQIRDFKNGKEIISENKSSRKKIFKKKETELKDSTQNELENIEPN